MRFHTPERRLSMYVCVCTVAVLLMPSFQRRKPTRFSSLAGSSSASASTGCTRSRCISANTQSRTCSAPRSASAQMQEYDYETRDGNTRITVQEFSRRSQGVGVTVFPLGLRIGATLAISGSVEGLPDIRMTFEGAGALRQLCADERPRLRRRWRHLRLRSFGWLGPRQPRVRARRHRQD